MGAYCGIDIALESVRTDARLRYNVGQHTFPAALFVGDCFEAPLPLPLQPFGPFDVVSCQFALHYSFGTEARARRALQNVAALLRVGGVFLGTTADADVLVRKLRATHGLRFGNELYGVEFDARHAAKTFSAVAPFGLEYRFTLADAVDDVAEYLVHRPTLERLAEECGLRLTCWCNFHEFVHERLKPECVHDRQLWTLRGLGGIREEEGGGALPPPRCALSEEEWEVAHLYAVFAFEKARRLPARDGDEACVLMWLAPPRRWTPRARRSSSWRRGARPRALTRARGSGASTAATSSAFVPKRGVLLLPVCSRVRCRTGLWTRRAAWWPCPDDGCCDDCAQQPCTRTHGLAAVIAAATLAPARCCSLATCTPRQPSPRLAGRRLL